MKNTCRPARDPRFELQKINNELQLYKSTENSAIYINETAALIWQLCDGHRKVGEIKKVIQESYPESDSDISKDVDEVLGLLSRHQAIIVS